MRPRTQRIEREPRPADEPYAVTKERPYMKPRGAARSGEGDWVTDELAAATTDVAGAVLSIDAHRELPGATGKADDLEQLKGVGPKFAARLIELGVHRFDQLASLGATEIALLDDKLGPFRGRLARDRVAEQADYLARGDIDGFEEKFGKLGA